MADGAEHAGRVFKEAYEAAVEHVHPEDAVDFARDTVLAYLEGIGETRPFVSGSVSEGTAVRVVNAEEVAEAVARRMLETRMSPGLGR